MYLGQNQIKLIKTIHVQIGLRIYIYRFDQNQTELIKTNQKKFESFGLTLNDANIGILDVETASVETISVETF